MSEPELEPDMVISPLSRTVIWNGHKFELEIYRLEDEPSWTLEVVNVEGTSTVRDDTFATDPAAVAEFRETLKRERIGAFRSRQQRSICAASTLRIERQEPAPSRSEAIRIILREKLA